jgi:hypothetical protein
VWKYRDSFAARAVAAAVKLKDEEIERLKHEGEEWMNVKNEILSDPEHWLSLANDRFNKDQADLTACRAQLASRDAEIKTLREALAGIRKIVVTNSWGPYDLSDIVNLTNAALSATEGSR